MNLNDQKKKTILLVCRYHRYDEVKSFEPLHKDFNVVYLYHIVKPDNELSYTNTPKIYWSDFKSPKDILDQVQPSVVVFFSLFSLVAISLNIACRKRGVKTAYLQHGTEQDYESCKRFDAISKKNRRAQNLATKINTVKKGNFSTIRFFFRTIGIREIIWLPIILIYSVVVRRLGGNFGYYFACHWFNFQLRKPDHYLFFSTYTSELTRFLDKPKENKIRYLGFRGLFDTAPETQKKETPYYLLIDMPCTDQPHIPAHIRMMTIDQKIEFYKKLLSYCKERNAKLVIKIHPIDYVIGWESLYEEKDLIWSKDKDVITLIKNSVACFCGASTLLVPTLFYKDVCYLKYGEFLISEDLIKRQLISSVSLTSFTFEEIKFVGVDRHSSSFKLFVRDYIHDDHRSFDENLRIALNEIAIHP
jgi:hypothetical protein